MPFKNPKDKARWREQYYGSGRHEIINERHFAKKRALGIDKHLPLDPVLRARRLEEHAAKYQIVELSCERCQAPIQSIAGRKKQPKWCSELCRKGDRKPVLARSCSVCGTAFETPNPTAVTCSKRCSIENEKRRRGLASHRSKAKHDSDRKRHRKNRVTTDAMRELGLVDPAKSPFRPRDEIGWLVSEPGTLSRTIYDLLRSGKRVSEVALIVDRSTRQISKTIQQFKKPKSRTINSSKAIQAGRDENGWLVSKPQTISRAVYELLRSGVTSPTEIGAMLDIRPKMASVYIYQIKYAKPLPPKKPEPTIEQRRAKERAKRQRHLQRHRDKINARHRKRYWEKQTIMQAAKELGLIGVEKK